MTAYLDSLDPAEIHDHYVDTITQENTMRMNSDLIDLEVIPEADSAADDTIVVPMDGGTADVVRAEYGHIEFSIQLGDRIVAAISLSSTEARSIGAALLQATR